MYAYGDYKYKKLLTELRHETVIFN